MSEPNRPILPILSIPTLPVPEQVSSTTGEGAQSALAAMIRKRKMAENNVDEDLTEGQPTPLPPP